MPEHLIGDKDALAAEYVLGTLDFEERAAAQSLRAQDAEFAGKVTVWERRLGELHLMVEPVEPELEIWQRIRTKLPEVHRPEPIIAVLDAEPVDPWVDLQVARCPGRRRSVGLGLALQSDEDVAFQVQQLEPVSGMHELQG